MAGPVVKRDLGHPYDPVDPQEEIMFLQHGCTIPTSIDLIDRTGILNPLFNGGVPNDRRLSLLTPETVAGINLDPLVNPAPLLPTPDAVTPDITFQRQMNHGFLLPVPHPTKTGLNAVEMWGFEDPLRPGGEDIVWPAKTIRVREGQVVHSHVLTRRGPHTIHHHGIEPTPMNDGVGHLTFEASGGGYSYQWMAAEAGTYFYHCHRNTVLHFEMGMYGMLIIDPPVVGAPFTDGGPGAVRRGNNIVGYDKEAVWVVDDIDSRWHDVVSMNVAAGIVCDFMAINDLNNPALHRFEPDFFMISGVIADPAAQNLITDPRVAVTVERGDTLLLRILNASYTVVTVRFPAALNPEVLAMDGRTLGKSGFGQYSSPFRIADLGNRFQLSTAQRWDLLLNASMPAGTYFVDIDYRHWVTGELLRTVRTRIVITD